MITHDAHLAAAVADRLWLVKDGQAKQYDGDLDDYRALILASNKTQGKADKKSRDKKQSAEANRKKSAAAREAIAPLKKKADAHEARVDELNEILVRLNKALAKPGLYKNDVPRAMKLQKERAALENAISKAEEAWMAALEKYETAKADSTL